MGKSESKFQRWQFTVQDFARMVESGILAENDRVELIDGEVRHMNPIGSLHAAIVNRLNSILTSRLGQRAIVSVQNPVILNDFTEPQPDIVVLRPRDDFYRKALPGPEDVLVVIEVADSTLEYDRDEKIPRYAKMRIPEAWLVDVNDQVLTLYSHPHGDGYLHSPAFAPGQELESVEIPFLRIGIDDVFLIVR
jgi:Uma2 family endonuclease